MKIFCQLLACLFLNFICLQSATAQLPYGLVDGRDHRYCEACRQTIESMPKEVLFGIHINSSGEVYFSVGSKLWFDKIIRNNSFGISIDIVAKSQYACNSIANQQRVTFLPRGKMLTPVYRDELIKRNKALTDGSIYMLIGKLPPSLANKEVEGNLVIVNGNYICYYTNFVNIDRDVWELLPMGLFTDSLLQMNKVKADTLAPDRYYTYSKKVQFEIPFQKGSSSFNEQYLQRFYDSLKLEQYHIRKASVRAYSSVEGPESVNKSLMQKRADIILKALQQYQPGLSRTDIVSAENWLDFFTDVKQANIAELLSRDKLKIKQKLLDKNILAKAEPLLAKERKAIVTLYLEKKTPLADKEETQLRTAFNNALNLKNQELARSIQKEIVERIIDNKLPYDYLNTLEIPKSKEYLSILNDREVYQYLLKNSSEYEALDHFKQLNLLDPDNTRIIYNICSLSFFMWQYGGDTTAPETILTGMERMLALKMNPSLVKRMFVNFHILNCEDNMRAGNYDAKDSSLAYIYSIYHQLDLSDDDLYSLAKYFTYYAQGNWALEAIETRTARLDVSEDLLFYYINLLFYSPDNYETDTFEDAVINAININPERFCRFFTPNDKGGASIQLLEYEALKKHFCSSCR